MTNDKQYERLVELLDAKIEYSIAADEPEDEFVSVETDELADYLLANGVIVPPCKIGTRVYAVINIPFVPTDVYEGEVKWYAVGEDGIRPTVEIKSDSGVLNGANFGLYPEDLFLSHEEAEAKLKEGVQG